MVVTIAIASEPSAGVRRINFEIIHESALLIH